MLFHDLGTARLLLKNISKDDTDFVFREFSDDSVNKYLFDTEPFVNRKEAEDLIDFYLRPEPRAQHRWILIKKDTGEKIGTCGFHGWDMISRACEVGYDLTKEYWGHGYMSEALRAILSFARAEMNVQTVNACISVDNQRSIALVQNQGFIFSGQKIYLRFREAEYEHYIFTYISEGDKHSNLQNTDRRA